MKALLILFVLGAASACSGPASLPPTVESYASGGGGAGTTSPCSSATTFDAGSGIFNFDATADVGLGIGTTNPTTPSDGSAAFSGDATVAPATGFDAGINPCR